MPHESRERDRDRRRLLTPPLRSERSYQRSPSRSRSRSRSRLLTVDRWHGSSSLERRERQRELERELRELELERERERLHTLESKVRRARSRLRSRATGSESRHRESSVPRHRLRRGDEQRERSKPPSPESRRRESSVVRHRLRRSHEKEEHGMPSSPTFTSSEVLNLIKSIGQCKPQASTAGPFNDANISNVKHKNILPNFDPSLKNQRVDIWLKKVNECATVYGWDERTTVLFAMEKLQGLAKTWYESLNSVLFSWPEWQDKLLSAFPWEQNYGQSLEDMLRRKARYGEPLEVYYYEKLSLLNQCDIVGRRAVDCIIHGLGDKTLKAGANALRCKQPEDLLRFLMSSKEGSQTFERGQYRNKISEPSSGGNPASNNRMTYRPNLSSKPGDNLFCFNCKEKGHPFLKCSKPLIQCGKCNRVGHTTAECLLKSDSGDRPLKVPKTMRISSTNSNSKFIKECTLNNMPLTCFIDFGSEVSLLTKSTMVALGLVCDDVVSPLKGFGNDVVYSMGGVSAQICIDSVSAEVICQVVEDGLLDVPLLIGQTFTEQPHIVVYKNVSELKFFDISRELPFPQLEERDHSTITLSMTGDAMIFGPAVIKARTDSIADGNVLLRSKLVGRPLQQFAVSGGVYRVNDGIAMITVKPIGESSYLNEGMAIARGSRVHVVNRIKTHSSDMNVHIHNKLDESNVKIGESVSEEDRKKLFAILYRFGQCFASELKELGCTDVAEMKIDLTSNRPIVYRPYRLSHKEREHVREMVGEMLEAGIVRESVSDYASPIILVRKKDGTCRLCVDYRLLNSVTVKERYPMPVIEDEIARLSGQAYFITLDLASGYYQVPIAENSKALTSFVTPDGQYEFNRMPFGLANAPAVFQRMMNRVLGSARFTEATAYIDDVLIYGKSVDECLERLEKVLILLKEAKLTLNLTKCEFLRDNINYLGYEISADGIRPGDKKIQSVLDFPCPTNAHSVRQFLGLVGYFRKFIRNFARLAHPLNRLLKKDVAWTWTPEQDEAFKVLKDRLVGRPILAIYDPAAETELHTDASKVGVGGILLQRSDSTKPFQPVAYYSRQTSPEERNFHAYELETLAVISSLRKFRVYLLGRDFKIVTDCSALRSTFSKRDLIPRVARWWLLLQEFQCTIEYRAGARMSHVDALSRNPITNNVTDVNQYPMIMTISNGDWLHTLQLGDSELCRIRDILTTDIDSEGLQYIKDNYLMKDNKLYKCLDGDKTKLRWVVPKGARWQLCRMNHDEIGHFGVEKTLERIKSTYWFPKMSRFIKKYVQACIECAYSKKTAINEGELHPITKVEVPFHTLHVDHLGPFVRSKRGNSYLLVVVDAFTKFVFIKPVRNTKTITATRVFDEIFTTFRNPDRIVSDRGTCFTSHAFKKFCEARGIYHVLNAVASPRSNGQVERYNRTIIASLTAQNLNSDERDWDDQVGKIQWGLNNTCQKTTGRMPAEVMFGPSMKGEVNPRFNEIVEETRETSDLETIREEVKDKIDEEQAKQKQYHDKNKRPARIYSEGDLVKITKTAFNNDGKSKKLLPSYIGPYRVTAVLGNDRYRVAAIPGLSGTKNKRKTTVATARMLPWVHIAALEVNENGNTSEEDDCDES